MILTRIRESKAARYAAALLSLSFLTDLAQPQAAMALTGGPSQPEVESFEPVGTTEMVNLFSGDFNYNIPLIDVGGYPVNLAYHGGIGMDQEASMVGLGWNINPGVINRNMRGLPDEFKGEKVYKEFNMRPNETYGVTLTPDLESFGLSAEDLGVALEYSVGMTYNTYKGIDISQTVGAAMKLPVSGTDNTFDLGFSATANGDGLYLKPKVSYSQKVKEIEGNDGKLSVSSKASIGAGYSSRSGLKNLTLSTATTGKYKANSGEVSKSTLKSTNYSPISLTPSSYVPSIKIPTTTMGYSFATKFGFTLFGVDGVGSIGGSYSRTAQRETSSEKKAYGYLHSEKGSSSPKAMLDFNRENDKGFSPKTQNLPLTIPTYDVYAISGQGTGGMFRPFRSDAGYVFDPEVKNTTPHSGDLSIDLSAANTTKVGGSIVLNQAHSKVSRWNQNNNAHQKLEYQANVSNPLYEPAYFKVAGEKIGESDPSFRQKLGGKDAVYVPIDKGPGLQSTAEAKLVNKDGSVTTNLNSPVFRNQRQKRNQNISYLTIAEVADGHGMGDHTNLLPFTNIYGSQSHHPMEITALQPGGARYIYGLPAYNTQQEEVSFNVAGNTADCATGKVQYDPDDASDKNEKGIDHYYSRTVLPDYAHSYLLTAVVAPDYVDRGTNGPTPDDIGGYTKFTYDKAYDDYKWRVPYNDANYSEGLKTDKTDDKGNYLYGTKQLFYLKTIETRTHIAIFHTRERQDAREVAGEHGGTGSRSMRLLEKIELFTKPDYDANGSSATPIKVVHFEYDYSLCGGWNGATPILPNNGGDPVDVNGNDPGTSGLPNVNQDAGKLTLKKVYFTYGKSNRGRFSPYEFEYSANNPNYDIKGYDRWGNFKPNVGTCNPQGNGLLNTEFPYTPQERIPNTAPEFDADRPDRTWADWYAEAWSLTAIQLPSGGSLKVDYEADDYAYVQDKRAMQMFQVTGMGSEKPDATNSNNIDPTSGDELYEASTPLNGGAGTVDDVLFFALAEPLAKADYPTTGDAAPFLANEYQLKSGNLFYFKFLVDLSKEGKYDYVPGFATIESFGVVDNAGTHYTHAYIEMEKVKRQKNFGVNPPDVSPIAKAAWQFARIHNPKLAFGLPDPTSSSVSQTIKAMANSNVVKQAVDMLNGPNGTLQRKNYGRKFVRGKSWVRLGAPGLEKKGGGARVARIAVNDGWDQMVPGQNDFEYGQEYDYSLSDGSSSGVAVYEPLIGGDENPMRQPIYGGNKSKLLAPDDEHYDLAPLGESFYPGPSVGYSKVTVRNLKRTDNTGAQIVTRNATGRTEHTFYTAKDFPVKVERTNLKSKAQRSDPVSQLLGFYGHNHMTASQGFSVILNDMHGKPKGQAIYPESFEGKETALSSLTYTYQTNSEHKLDNVVDVLQKDGTTTQAEVGVDFDFISDFRQEKSHSATYSTNGNIALFMITIFPGIVPTIIPKVAVQKSRFRSAVVTKVVNQYGILKETTAFDRGSTVKTSNLAWDAETGEVLVTETQNDYDDPVYSMTFPAHWGYERMGAAYQNIGAQFSVTAAGNNGQVNNPNNILKKGDQLIALSTTGVQFRGTVWDDDDLQDNEVHIIQPFGSVLPNGIYDVKVIRSGYRNQQNAPMASLTTLVNPLTNFATNSYAEVIEASAIEYSEEWQMECGYQDIVNLGPCTCNTTPEATQLQAFLNELADEGDLVSPEITGLTGGAFPTFTPLNTQGGASATYQSNAGKFVKSFQGYDWIKSMDAVTDDNCGYYVLGGAQNPNSSSSELAVLAKVDEDGNVQWSRSYENIYAYAFQDHLSFARNPNNEIAIVSTNGDGVHAILVDGNNQGALLQEVTLKANQSAPPGVTDYYSGKIIYVPNAYGHAEGFAIAGGADQSKTAWVTKLSTSFTEEWSHELSSWAQEISGFDLIEESVNPARQGFVLAAHGYEQYPQNNVGKGDLGVTQISPTGNLHWQQTYSQPVGPQGQLGESKILSVDNAYGAGFIVASPYKDNTDNFQLSRLSIDGNSVLWTRTFNMPNYEAVHRLHDNGDGTFLALLGHKNPGQLATTSKVLVHFDGNGTINWTRRYSSQTNALAVVKQAASCGSGYALFGRGLPGENVLTMITTHPNGVGSGCDEFSLFPLATTNPLITKGAPVQGTSLYQINTALGLPGVALFNGLVSDENECCEGGDLIGQIDYTTAPTGDCNFTLSSPYAGFCFTDVTGVSNLVPGTNALGCNDVYDFTVTATLATGGTVIIQGTNTCWPMSVCTGTGNSIASQCGQVPGDIINPYRFGVRGNFRPKRSYAYLTDRYTDPANPHLLRKDGYYTSFNPFYEHTNGGDWDPEGLIDVNWTFASEVTRIHPDGMEVENRDALNRYSAAVMGYDNTLPLVVGNNTSYRSLGYDGFEDYGYLPSDCDRQHFNFADFVANLNTDFAHSGRYSMRVSGGNSVSLARELTLAPCAPSPDQIPYEIKECDCLGIFGPETDATESRKFIVSYWVKESVALPTFDYTDHAVRVELDGTALVKSDERHSPVIDGWQWHRFTVEIPATSAITGTGQLKLFMESTSATNFFDDVRMHPFQAGVTSYVYDPVSLRLMAELDANNFATFYEYDEAGQLIRVKKETERGIMTLQENRNHTSN